MDSEQLAAASILEAMSISESSSSAAAPDASAGNIDNVEVHEAAESNIIVGGTDDVQHPPKKVERAPLRESTNGQDQQPATRSSVVPADASAVSDEAGGEPGELLQPPAVDMLKSWATQSFANPTGSRMELPALSAAYQSTNGLLINSKEAVRLLFEQQRSKICSSPERPDLKLSQEEALGWLLAHACCRRLLVAEARKIGKVAGKQAGVAKQQRDAVRDAAKTKRSKARKRDATVEELVAIDSAAEAERSAIFLNIFELAHMPAANTEIVESRPPKAAPTTEHVCSEACSRDEMCPRARAYVEAAMSDEAAVLIVAAFRVWALEGDGRDPHFNEELQVAQLRYSHALRPFKQEHTQFCGWSERSWLQVIDWTIRCAAAGFPIPAAEKVAGRVGFDMPRLVQEYKAEKACRQDEK